MAKRTNNGHPANRVVFVAPNLSPVEPTEEGTDPVMCDQMCSGMIGLIVGAVSLAGGRRVPVDIMRRSVRDVLASMFEATVVPSDDGALVRKMTEAAARGAVDVLEDEEAERFAAGTDGAAYTARPKNAD